MKYRFKIGDYFLFHTRNIYLIGKINAINNVAPKSRNFIGKPIFYFDILLCNDYERILSDGDIRDSKCFSRDSIMYNESIVSNEIEDIKDKAMVELL